MTDIPERLRTIVSSPEANPPLIALLTIADEVQALADELDATKEKLRVATAHERALVKYCDQQNTTLGKIYDLLNDGGQSLAMFVVQELHPDEFAPPPPPAPPAPPEPVYCEECDNDITYDCSTCAPTIDSTDFVEQPETD